MYSGTLMNQQTKLDTLYTILFSGYTKQKKQAFDVLPSEFNKLIKFEKKPLINVKDRKTKSETLIQNLMWLIAIPTILLAKLADSMTKFNLDVQKDKETRFKLDFLIDQMKTHEQFLYIFAKRLANQFFLNNDFHIIKKKDFLQRCQSIQFCLISPQDIRKRYFHNLLNDFTDPMT